MWHVGEWLCAVCKGRCEGSVWLRLRMAWSGGLHLMGPLTPPHSTRCAILRPLGSTKDTTRLLGFQLRKLQSIQQDVTVLATPPWRGGISRELDVALLP